MCQMVSIIRSGTRPTVATCMASSIGSQSGAWSCWTWEEGWSILLVPSILWKTRPSCTGGRVALDSTHRALAPILSPFPSRLLREAGDAVRLLDASDKVPGLLHKKGLESWVVASKDNTFYERFEQVPEVTTVLL